MSIHSGRPLDLLESAGLLSLSMGEPDPEYSFKHSLVQETAYASLVRARRVELHRQVAEAMEAMGPAADAPAAILALHFKEAGLPGKAFEYAVLAGDQAQRTYAQAEAMANYDLALSLVPELAEEGLAERLRGIYSRRGSVLEVTGRHREAEENYQAMRREAARLNDDRMQADALNRLATVRAVTFNWGDAESLLAEALSLADRSRDLPMIARTLWNHGLYYRFHEPEKASEYFRKALGIVQRPDCQMLGVTAGIRELEGLILADLRVTQLVAGQFLAATQSGRRALEVFRSIDHKAMIADSLAGASIIAYYCGRPEEASRLSSEGIEISRAILNPWGQVYNSWTHLDSALDHGHFDEALDRGNRQLAVARQVTFPVFVGAIESFLARVYAAVGQPEACLEHAQACLEPFTSGASRASWEIWGLGTLGLALLELGRVDEAAERLEPIFKRQDQAVRGFQGYFAAGPTLLRLALETSQWDRGLDFADWLLQWTSREGARRVEVDLLHWRGRLRAATGALDLARGDYEDAAEGIRSVGYATLEWQNDAHLAVVLGRLGRQADAAAARSHAEAQARQLLDGIRSTDMRETFARKIADTLESLPDR